MKGLSDRLKPVCLILVPNLWMQTWQQSSLPVSLLPMQWNHLQISWHWKIEGIETLPELRTWERDQQSYKLAAKMVSFIRILNKTWNHKYFPETSVHWHLSFHLRLWYFNNPCQSHRCKKSFFLAVTRKRNPNLLEIYSPDIPCPGQSNHRWIMLNDWN